MRKHADKCPNAKGCSQTLSNRNSLLLNHIPFPFDSTRKNQH